MNLTYYGFRPFKITPGKVVVLATGSPHIYQEIILGLQDRTDTVKLSDDNFTTVTVGKGAQWYGDPLLNVDLNALFQRKLQTRLLKVLADDQTVGLVDGLQSLLSQLLADSYLMDVPLELPETPELAKLIKFSGIQLVPDLRDDVYGILETLVKALIELNDHRMVVLTNVGHYLQVSQLQSLVRFMANIDLPILLIEFSSTKQSDYFRNCDYHYIDSDFVLW